MTEHVSLSAGDTISLDDVIAKLQATGDEDTRAKEILAAAITLRDTKGRDRKVALRQMANAWGVTVNENIEGKYKPRSNSALAEDIQASVCRAALDWESCTLPSQGSDTRSLSRPDAEPVLKKARRTSDAAHASGTLQQLSETANDVLPNTLSRLGPDEYQATLRCGMIWRGNAELLRSLPQGEARLATLQTRERVAHAKAKAKVKAKAEEKPPRDQDEPAESSASRSGGGDHGEADASDHGGGAELHGAPSKRQRTLRQMFLSSGPGQASASHDDEGERVESSAAEHCDADPATTSAELFVSDREEDKILLDWLRERPEHTRCSVLLRQIMEWTKTCHKEEMRALA